MILLENLNWKYGITYSLWLFDRFKRIKYDFDIEKELLCDTQKTLEQIKKLQDEGRHEDAKHLSFLFEAYQNKQEAKRIHDKLKKEGATSAPIQDLGIATKNQIRKARKEGIGSSPTAFLIITCSNCQNKFNLKPVNFEGYVACPKCNFPNFVESLYWL